MAEPPEPSPFSPPQVDSEPVGRGPPPGRVGFGLLWITIALCLLTAAFVRILDPSEERLAYWVGSFTCLISGGLGLRSGWKMSAGLPGGWGWFAIPVGLSVIIATSFG